MCNQNPPDLPKFNEALQQATTIDKIDLVDISSSDSEDNDQENIDVSESENCSNVEAVSSSNESDSDTDLKFKVVSCFYLHAVLYVFN